MWKERMRALIWRVSRSFPFDIALRRQFGLPQRTLRWWDESNAPTPWDESCSPDSDATSRALRSSGHESLHSFADVAMRGKIVRVNSWFRQARQPTLTACGGVSKFARCCLPRPSRRFAKRTNEPWALNLQDTIAFVSARCGSLHFHFLFVLLFVHAVVISMFTVFLA